MFNERIGSFDLQKNLVQESENRPTGALLQTSKVAFGLFDNLDKVAAREDEEQFWRNTVTYPNETPMTPRNEGKQRGPVRLSFSESPPVFSSTQEKCTPKKRAGSSMNSYSKEDMNDAESPLKKSKTEKSLFEELFRVISSGAQFSVLGKVVRLSTFAKGTYMQSYTLSEEQPVFDTVANSQLLLKAYHGEKTKFTDKLAEYLQSSLKNYNHAIRLDIPVSKIYNEATALQDRFLLVEKIPLAINLNDNNQNDNIQIDAVIKLIEKSFKNKIAFDLSYENLRVAEDGKVVLVDFVEKEFDFNNEQKRRIFVIQYLKSWVSAYRKVQSDKSYVEQALAKLTRRLSKEDGFNSDWNNSAIEEYY